jgi:hypothetical protein
MKRIGCTLGIVAALFASQANATLIDRGGGLIYDDVLNITWLQDANYAKTSGYDADGLMTWDQATAWATNLVYGGYSDWRLPTVAPVNGISFNDSYSPDGSTDFGYNNTSPNSEIAFMFYINLGNQGSLTPSGALSGCYVNSSDTCLDNVGFFSNIEPYFYWSGTEVSHTPSPGGFFGNGDPGDSFAWTFVTIDGVQRADLKIAELNAWAVRDGDVTSPIPEPSTWALLLMGFGLLAGITRRT